MAREYAHKTTEEIKLQARNKRYKKPIHKTLNLDSITDDLYEMQSVCEDVDFYFQDENGSLVNALIGDDDESGEFKLMFSDLYYDIECMIEDLRNDYVPEFYDLFMAAISDAQESLFGWDEYEGDYMKISPGYETRIAIEEARTKMKRFTKDQILEGSCDCFRVTVAYMSLKSRYEDLKASLDIIRGQNKAEINVLKNINDLYKKANEESDGFRYKYCEAITSFDKFVNSIDPYSRLWLE